MLVPQVPGHGVGPKLTAAKNAIEDRAESLAQGGVLCLSLHLIQRGGGRLE